MDNVRDAAQRLAHVVATAHVAMEALDLEMQILRKRCVGSVHLVRERVDHTHPMTLLGQTVGEMRTDEAGSAGDENAT